jgi:alpha-mannosidase
VTVPSTAEGVVAEALATLRAAADEAHRGWLPERFGPYGVKRIEGMYGGVGSIDGGLPLAPGRSLTIACDLHSPTGEALELMLWSLFPTTLRLDGRLLSDDEVPIAACGPALIPLAPAGVLEMTVHAPDHQLFNEWHWFRFTTPSTRRRFNELDTAWAQLYLAAELATGDDERKAVELAAHAALDDDLAGMVDTLLPLADRAAAFEVHFVGHSHIDMNWLWRRPDTDAVVLRDMASVLALMDDYPEMRFTHSQPATYEIVRTQAPVLFERIKGHIGSGRWEPATLQWVEGDTNMASSEATARQLLEAVRYSRDVLGAQPNVLLAPDTFGHAGNLPQLVASAGGRAYYHHRANPGHAAETIWPAYWWEGQDGTRVLALSTPTYSGEITAGDAARLAVLFARDKGLSAAMFFYGVGDHGGGPTRESLETLRYLQAQPLLPQMKCSTVADFADAVAGPQLPVHRGESATTFEGCYTTHTDTKVLNRQGESLLETAETLAALAGVEADLGLAWKTVLFNQFHDILDGSAIRQVYEDQAAEFEADVWSVAQPVIDESLAALAGDGITVVNPLGWDRTDVVCVPGVPGVPGAGAVFVRANNGETTIGQHTEDGLVFLATVPAFATAVYTVGDAAEVPDMAVDEDERYLRIGEHGIRIRKEAGVLTSQKDFRPELAHNVLTVADEHPHDMSAWDIRDVHAEHSLLRGAQTTIVERGPVRTVVEVRHAVRRSTITERIAFYAGLPRIDFEADIDWREPGGDQAGVPSLKVSFATPLTRPEAWFETPFAAVERPADGQESPALRWAAVQGGGHGFAVLNDSRHGYDALGSRLRLSLVRTAYSPDTASDIGRHRTRFALYPYDGDWRDARVVQQAASFNRPLLACRAQGPGEQPRWRPVVEGTAVVSGLKRRQNQWVLRLYDATGRGATARFEPPPPARAAVYEATITEDRVRPVDPAQTLTLRPWQVLTLVIEER